MGVLRRSRPGASCLLKDHDARRPTPKAASGSAQADANIVPRQALGATGAFERVPVLGLIRLEAVVQKELLAGAYVAQCIERQSPARSGLFVGHAIR